MSDLIDTALGIATGGLLVLDSMVFTDFALPEKVRFGGAQQMTVHKLPGGNRVFDVTGLDQAAISWSGIWLGPSSEVSRRQMEAIRDAGLPVDLIVGFQFYRVMVREAQFEQRHMRVDYQITCEVVPDPGPEEQDDDTGSLGTGEPADTPQKAQDQGQAKVAASRKIAAQMPVPPIPPTNAGALVG